MKKGFIIAAIVASILIVSMDKEKLNLTLDGTNFNLSEFEYSHAAITKNISNKIPADGQVINAIIKLVHFVLQPLRTFLGRPVNIISGYRTSELNAIVGGVPNSQHMYGEAADIQVTGLNPVDIARAIIKLSVPYDQLILYPTFVHVSHKLSGNQRKMLIYDKSYKGAKV